MNYLVRGIFNCRAVLRMNKVLGFGLLALLATTGFALNIPGIPTDFTQDDDVLAALSADIAERYAVEYKQYLKTGRISPTLRHISEQMSKAHSQKDIFTQDITELAIVDQFVACTSCQALLKVVADTFVGEEGELNGPQREGFCRKAMLGVCDFFSLQTPEVCNGLFDLNYPIMEYILENTVAEVRSLCGILPIKFCKTKQIEFEFTLNLDKGKPLLTAPKSNKPVKTDKDLHVLHFTDIHYDPDYKPGSVAVCPEPMCCNRMPTGNVPEYQLAGYWSDYRDCDSPKHFIENTFTQVRGLFDKIDMIYHTGDVVAHNVWSTTKEGNIEVLTEADKLLSEKFPGVPVYSILGNHEPHPANVFGGNDLPEDLNINWLYEHVWSLWSKWLPADQRQNVLKGGYYTVSPKAGLRVIGLNNMDCYMYNWWVYLDGSLVIPQLQWLHDTLLASEKAGEYVHILAHIPSADSGCWTVWAREYNRIIERFSSTISGIFNGHTHKDELNVHYSQNGHAMMVSWNGGSLTTYSNKNPNFKFYEIEPNTFQVVDQQTFITNLTEANLQGSEVEPAWMLEYSFSDRFTDDLSPAGLDKLLVKMAEQPELLREYWRYKMTSADPRLAKGCDNKCLLKTICRLSKSVYNNNTRCRELQAILEKTLGIDSTTTTPRPTTSTQKPGTETTSKKPEDEDDGAASITASITTIVGLAFLLRYIF